MTTPLLPPEHLKDHEWHWLKSKFGRVSAVLWSNGSWWIFGYNRPFSAEEAAEQGRTYIAPAYPPTEEEAAKLREPT